MSTDLAQLACDRYEIADTLHRYAFGLDHNDADSLASAFTEDCVLDFTPAGKKLELNFPKLTGRQAIVEALLPLLGPLDTSHTASNLQIEIREKIPPRSMPMSWRNISCREKVRVLDRRTRS